MSRNEEIATTSSFCHAHMAVRQVEGLGYEIIKFDERGDYLHWKRQVKEKLESMGLGMLLRKKSDTVNNIEWKYMQEHAMYIVLGISSTCGFEADRVWWSICTVWRSKTTISSHEIV